MPTAVKKCRVCGKEYEACRSANKAAGVFRWQEVACSPECGQVYLDLIQKSRSKESPRVFGQTKKGAVRIAEKRGRHQVVKKATSEPLWEDTLVQKAELFEEPPAIVSEKPAEAE